MKKIINPTILTIIITIISYTLLIPHSSYAVDNIKSNSQQQTVKQQVAALVKNEPTINDLLITILHNAQFVVKQIKNSTYNSVTRKEALSAIKKAQKKLLKHSTPLPKNIYDEISAHITSIEKEAGAFARHQSHIKKYNSANAEEHLQDLARTINHTVENLSESFVAQNYQKLEQAIIKTENTIKNAQTVINTTNAQRAENKISRLKAAHIIGEQKNIITNAQKALEIAKQNALNNVSENDAQISYLAQLTTAASSLGKQIVAPFKSGYGYTDQEKDVARAVIAELEKDQNNYIRNAHQALQNPQLSPANKDALLTEYTETIDAFNNAIHEQQLITGDAMSFNRKLFWAAVGFAGAIGGAYLGYQYFNQTPTDQVPNVNNQHVKTIITTSDNSPESFAETSPSAIQEKHVNKLPNKLKPKPWRDELKNRAEANSIPLSITESMQQRIKPMPEINTAETPEPGTPEYLNDIIIDERPTLEQYPQQLPTDQDIDAAATLKAMQDSMKKELEEIKQESWKLQNRSWWPF
jgi:hypothetical protein